MPARTFKVSDDFYCASPVVRLGNSVIGFWTLAGIWVAGQDTDELAPVPKSILREFSGSASRWSRELEAADLWQADGKAWRFCTDHRLYRFDRAPTTRADIPEDLRLAVYARDGWACLHCSSDKALSLDHIYPWSLGGPDTYENLQTLCRPCNSRKGAKV